MDITFVIGFKTICYSIPRAIHDLFLAAMDIRVKIQTLDLEMIGYDLPCSTQEI
jgi:hypothetical protein